MSTAHQRNVQDLPARSIEDTLESLSDDTRGLRVDFAREARLMSAIEWQCDLLTAASERDRLQLTSEGHADLIERLRARNRAIWGTHCAAD